MTVIQPGALTTVQDLGRPGARHMGVPLGGAADALSMRLANIVVGNHDNAAGLECTLTGPRLRFTRDVTIAVAGATVAGIEPLRPIRIAAGKTISIEHITRGCRAYVAVAGGIDVPVVLGGRGTELSAGFGGWHGRPLSRGDVLPIGPAPVSSPQNCRVNLAAFAYARSEPVRMLPGKRWVESSAGLCGTTFTASPKSDRMGVRLDGPTLSGGPAQELLSFAVAPGAIQIPPDGRPIVLLPGAQTIGGYPVVAHVVAADLHRIAQLRPGDAVRFIVVTIEQARAAAVARRRLLDIIRHGIAGALRVNG